MGGLDLKNISSGNNVNHTGWVWGWVPEETWILCVVTELPKLLL